MGSVVENVVEYRSGTHTHVTVEEEERRIGWKFKYLNHYYILGL